MKPLHRISKLMSQRGICSRREADALIEKGQVYLNDQKVELGQKATEDCQIEVREIGQNWLDSKVSIILNKPIGIVSNLPEDDYSSGLELIIPENRDHHCRHIKFDKHHLKGLAPAGRLDIDSKGLIIYTQDGQLAKKIIGENSNIEKEYLVRVSGKLSDDELNLLRSGMTLDGVDLKPAVVDWLNDDQLKFILKQGRKRQIRRMCEMVGLNILGLKRVRVGRLLLSSLPEGKWRYLKSEEQI